MPRSRAAGDLDQRQQVRRVEGVADDRAARRWATRLNIGHGQARGAGGDHHIGGHLRAEPLVERLLDAEVLGCALLDELRVPHCRRQVGGHSQPFARGARGQTQRVKTDPGRVDEGPELHLLARVVEIGGHIIAAGEEMRGPAGADGAAAEAGDVPDGSGRGPDHRQRPLNSGLRFSTKARTPSSASSDFNIAR